jgi:hypothetical protein
MNLSLEVNAEIHVSEETAAKALFLLNCYLKETPRNSPPTITKCSGGVGYVDYYRIEL